MAFARSRTRSIHRASDLHATLVVTNYEKITQWIANFLELLLRWYELILFRISSNLMGDDGTMARGTRYTTEFRAKAVRLPSESRTSYSSGERDTDDGVGFLRGEARPDTALMATYIDEHAAYSTRPPQEHMKQDHLRSHTSTRFPKNTSPVDINMYLLQPATQCLRGQPLTSYNS